MTEHPRIALAMIVRNEARVIERCLGSARPVIDTWTIIDTGSDDDTIARIEGALVGIPGQVAHRPWRDFSTNRNELLELARPTADYLLLLDADMTIRILENDPVAALTAPIYEVLVEGGVHYRMPYLISTAVQCHYVGKTHEFLSYASTDLKPQPFDGFVITHLGDGGSRAEKFQRDLRLLEAEAMDDPGNARTMFYLAQTREGLGDVPGAIAAYRRRIELAGWDEEVFWSMYRSGVLLEQAGDWSGAAQMYVTAWEFRPHRVEPVLQLARGYREAGAHRTAVLWAEVGAAIPYPAADRLFVERWMYDWGMDLELAADVWWVGDHERAQAIWMSLLQRSDLTEGARSSVQANLNLID